MQEAPLVKLTKMTKVEFESSFIGILKLQVTKPVAMSESLK